VLFLGSTGYFFYLADRDRFRSVVLSDLRQIMSFAGLDKTYCIEDWFVKKGRLLVQVAKRSQRARTGLDTLRKRLLSRLGREFSRLH